MCTSSAKIIYSNPASDIVCLVKTTMYNQNNNMQWYFHIFKAVKKLQSPAKKFKVQPKSSLFCFELPENCIYLNQSELRIFFLYPIKMIMYMKKLCASDWLKMNAFSCNTSAKLSHKCKLQVAWVHFQNFICHDSLCCFSVYNINK